MIRASSANPIYDLFPPKQSNYITEASEKDTWNLLRDLNRDHMAQREGDSRLDARIASYEMAAKLQLSAPEVLDISGEIGGYSKAVRAGRKNHGRSRAELPDRAPYAGAGRSFRSGVERRGQRFPAAQLGQPRESGAGSRGDGGRAWTSLPPR